MIFLDTSAIYALADRGDKHHTRARQLFAHILDSHEALLTHNYILVESAALIQNRLGNRLAVRFLREAELFSVRWVDEQLHREAVSRLMSQKRKGISFVDCVSFVLMEHESAGEAFAFDADFPRAGFPLYTG